jgi:hypothetical protein
VKPNKLILICFAALLSVLPKTMSQGVVDVTLSLDAATINAGETTTLHVFAQIIPDLRAESDRIFSWYVDVLNTNGAAASANYNAMLKTASDNDPSISSKGTPQGANQRGIYDTFINQPGAGTTNKVELMAIPVTGLAAGQTRFLVQSGTTVFELFDFIVAPAGGRPNPKIGGIYSAAFADLTVIKTTGPCSIQLAVGHPAPNGAIQLTFTPCAGRDHTVQYRAALNDAPGWLAFPGAPHNSGAVTVTNTTIQRFFRVVASGN